MKPVLDLFRVEKSDSTLLDMCPEFFAAFSDLPKEAGSEKKGKA